MRSLCISVMLTFAASLCMAGVATAQISAISRIGGVPMRLPHQKPAIFRIDLPDHNVHAGEEVRGAVITSSNVASVEARLRGYSMSLRHSGIGRFTLTYHVPWLPPFFRGTWPVNLIARNVDGVATQKMVYVKYQ